MSRAAAPAASTPAPAWWPSLAAGLVALAAYLALAPHVAGDKDAAEFTLVLGARGVAHPSGYPLYTLLGHPFVAALHAAGASWAFAANAWTALGGAVAVLLLHRLAWRLAQVAGAAGALLACLPALLFGLNPLWTYEATLAETGSWHVAWAAGAALLALRLLHALAAATAPGPREWRRGALAWGLLAGAGLAHHLTSVLLLLPLTAALALAARRRDARPSLALLVVLGALAPLASYGWVAWRAFHPGAAQWPTLASTWGAVWDHLTAAQYHGYFGGFRPSAGQASLLVRYAYPFLAIAAVALAWTIRAAGAGPRRSLVLAVAAGCALQVAVVFTYGVPDPGSYFVPVLALGLAALAPALAPAVARRGLVLGALIAVVAPLALGVGWTQVAWQRREAFVKNEQMLRRMWGSVTVDRGFVLWHSDMVHQLLVWQVLDGEKPGLTVLNPAHLTHAWPRQAFLAAHGFDPVAGLAAPAARARSGQEAEAQLVEAIAGRLNTQSDLPVIIFDMAGPSVLMLRKPQSEPGR